MKYAAISSENTRKLLESRKISIRQLAFALGISPSSLTDSLKSQRGLSIDLLFSIADYFGLCVNDLCDPTFVIAEGGAARVTTADAVTRKYNELDLHGKEVVDVILRKEYDRCMAAQEN